MFALLSAGIGLVLLAAGFWVIGSVMKPANETRQLVVPSPLAHDEHQFPILSAAQLFEQTGTLGVHATIEAKLGFSREQIRHSVSPVIHAYAELVQLLPAAESQCHAQPGGLLIRALEVVDLALTFRRGQILPSGGVPEDIMRLEHRWTYAVFVAALLHDIGQRFAKLCVTINGPGAKEPAIWTPLCGPMQECGAVRYTVSFAPGRMHDDQSYQKLSVLLFQRWVPEDVIGWLSEDRELVSELMATLSGEQVRGSGAVKALVMRADTESVRRNCLPAAYWSEPFAASLHPIAVPNSTHDRAHIKNEIAVVERTASASGQGTIADRPNDLSRDAKQDLDAVDESPDDGKSKSPANHVKLTAPKPELLAPVAPALPPPSNSKDAQGPAEAALRFMSWLQAGLRDGTITFNNADAMVHFVKEGILLVSPRIFQCFAKTFGEDGRGATPSSSRESKELGMGIQKEWLKAGWHLRGKRGMNILPYQVLREGKPAARVSGVVIANPQSFVSPVPPPNPYVVKL